MHLWLVHTEGNIKEEVWVIWELVGLPGLLSVELSKWDWRNFLLFSSHLVGFTYKRTGEYEVDFSTKFKSKLDIFVTAEARRRISVLTCFKSSSYHVHYCVTPIEVIIALEQMSWICIHRQKKQQQQQKLKINSPLICPSSHTNRAWTNQINLRVWMILIGQKPFNWHIWCLATTCKGSRNQICRLPFRQISFQVAGSLICAGAIHPFFHLSGEQGCAISLRARLHSVARRLMRDLLM